MKKLFYLAAAITVMASCTNETIVGDATNVAINREGTPISFNSKNAATTRADYDGGDAAALLNNNFVVEGVKGDGSTQEVVFDHYNVNWVTGTAHTTTSNTADWEYVAQLKHDHANISAQSIKYWDYATTQYDFIAYSAGKATAIFTGTPGDGEVLYTPIVPSKMNGVKEAGVITDGAYKVTGKAEDLAKVYIADLKTVYRDKTAENDALGDYNKEVEFKFRSLSAKVRLALYETVPGYSIQGSSVKFYNAADDASPNTTAKLFTTAGSGDVFNEAGTYIVYYPTTGASNVGETDYNKAHVKFTPAETSGSTDTKKAFGTFNSDRYVKEEVDENGDKTTENGDNLYIGRSSNTATYADPNTSDNTDHYYTIVIPNETGAVLNLKVDYTLISTDGSGEEINVTGATAQVPAIYATWKSGYAYTYIFKISQDTNGATNPSAGPAGLYPITFDAVVMNNEVDGIQETITTVATPSITTYAKGEVVTANNEYLTGNNIYVKVEGGANTVVVGSTAFLYTVTLESGAAQTINEASVANAIKNGTWNGSAHTYTVTDANDKKMVVTVSDLLKDVTEIAADDAPDGNAIEINGAKFTPSAAGDYVFQYAKTVTTAATYNAVADGTTLTAGDTYYTSDAGAGLFIAKGDEVADGTNYFVMSTPAEVSEWAYKIIKVVAPAP